MRALIRKEALENLRWLPLALLLTTSMLIASVGEGWLSDISSTTSNFLFISSLLSIGLALLQSIPDERNGARAYLLHRGVSASDVFWSKALVGFTLIFASVVVPLGIFAIWLEMRGVLNAPGRPLQLMQPAVLSLTGFLFYPAVQLVIYRPARWLGSRCLPVVLPLVVAFVSGQSIASGDGSLLLHIIVAGFTLVTLVVYLLAARHAYVNLAVLPPSNSKAHRSATLVLLLVATMCVVTTAFTVAVSTVDQGLRKPSTGFHHVVFNKHDNHLWLVHSRQRWSQEKNRFELEYINGSPLVAGKVPDISGSIPADFDIGNGSPLETTLFRSNDPAFLRVVGVVPTPRWIVIADRRGYLLCYNQLVTPGIRLGQVISRDGIHDPQGDWGEPFEQMYSVDNYNRSLGMVGDKSGLYQIDEANGKVWPVIKGSIDAHQLNFDADQPLQLITRTGSRLTIYAMSDETGPMREDKKDATLTPTGRITASLVDEIELPASVIKYPMLVLYYQGKNSWTVHGWGTSGSLTIGTIAQQLPDQPKPTSFTVPTPPEAYHVSVRDIQIGTMFAMPLTLLGPYYDYFTVGRENGKSIAEVAGVPATWIPWIIAVALLQGAIAAALTWRVAHRRGLSRQASLIWTGLSFAIGWAAPLSVLACYPRLVRESCSHCHKPRRVDLVRCEHCQGAWERLQREGVEIIEHEFDSQNRTSEVLA